MTQQRRPRGQSNGGQFAPEQNPECLLDLVDDVGDAYVASPWRNRVMVIGGVPQNVDREVGRDGSITYHVTDQRFGGAWHVEYEPASRMARANGRRPNVSALKPEDAARWRDEGSVDIRTVVKALEPTAALVRLDGSWYRLDDDRSHPLSEDEMSGFNTAQMRLNTGDSAAEIGEYIEANLRSLEMQEQFHPERQASIDSNRRFLRGMKFATKLGSQVARANTVGAMEARAGR